MVTVNNNLFPTQTMALKPTGAIASLLKVGQTFTANIQSVEGNQVKLSIGNQTLLATTKQPLQENGSIQVRVNQVTPDVQLAIVTSKGKTSPSIQAQQTAQIAYRQFIPSQSPLTQVFQQISLLQSLPATIQAPVQQLLNQINKGSHSLSAQDIKQKLTNSGLFLESKIHTGDTKTMPAALKNDIKAQVLQLQQQVSTAQSQTPSSSLTKLAGLLSQALSRLTVQQVQLFENPNITPLEIPFQRQNSLHKDLLEFRKGTGNAENTWEAYIDLTLPDGLLSTKLKLSENGNLDCFVWCETDELKESVAENLESLKTYLESCNLNINHIQISPTRPAKTQNSTKVALIDIKI